MRPPYMAKWEYLNIRNDMMEHTSLDELGAEGWELVSVVSFNNEGNTDHFRYFFKRLLVIYGGVIQAKDL